MSLRCGDAGWQSLIQYLIHTTINRPPLSLQVREMNTLEWWGSPGYTLFRLFWLNYIDCGCSLEPPHPGGSNEHPQSITGAEISTNH